MKRKRQSGFKEEEGANAEGEEDVGG